MDYLRVSPTLVLFANLPLLHSLKDEKKDVPYLVLFGLSVLFFIFLFFRPGTDAENPCTWHKKLFQNELVHATVISKFIDERNHSLRRVIIKEGNENIEISFIPYSNWNDFEKIKVGDFFSKPRDSFLFTLNGQYRFVLNYDCDYNHSNTEGDGVHGQ